MPTAPGQTTPGLPSVDFYAPSFEILVDNRKVEPHVLAEVQELKVTLEKDAIDGFDLVLANPWDAGRGVFKYGEIGGIFDLCSLVHVRLGYADHLVSMVSGQITRMSPRFSESGSTTIGISGQNGMVRLRDRKPKPGEARYFQKRTDSEIAQIVAQRNQLAVRVDPTPEKRDVVAQGDLDDARFLRQLARKNDYECYAAWDPDARKDTLFFVKPTDGRSGKTPGSFRFEWGKDLMSFTPDLTLARQVSKVTVKGWDPRTKKPISFTAKQSDLAGPNATRENGPAHIEKSLGDKEDLVVKVPVATAEEAKARAIALLRDRAYQFASATGQAVGQPDMRPGDNVQIVGVLQRFSGDYYVTRVEHSLGNNGFLTTFSMKRPGMPEDSQKSGGGA